MNLSLAHTLHSNDENDVNDVIPSASESSTFSVCALVYRAPSAAASDGGPIQRL